MAMLITMAMIYIVAVVNGVFMLQHQQNLIAEFQSLLATALQKEGRHVKQSPPSGEGGAGMRIVPAKFLSVVSSGSCAQIGRLATD